MCVIFEPPFLMRLNLVSLSFLLCLRNFNHSLNKLLGSFKIVYFSLIIFGILCQIKKFHHSIQLPFQKKILSAIFLLNQ